MHLDPRGWQRYVKHPPGTDYSGWRKDGAIRHSPAVVGLDDAIKLLARPVVPLGNGPQGVTDLDGVSHRHRFSAALGHHRRAAGRVLDLCGPDLRHGLCLGDAHRGRPNSDVNRKSQHDRLMDQWERDAPDYGMHPARPRCAFRRPMLGSDQDELDQKRRNQPRNQQGPNNPQRQHGHLNDPVHGRPAAADQNVKGVPPWPRRELGNRQTGEVVQAKPPAGQQQHNGCELEAGAGR